VKIKNNSAPNCIQIVGPKGSMIKTWFYFFWGGGGGGGGGEKCLLRC